MAIRCNCFILLFGIICAFAISKGKRSPFFETLFGHVKGGSRCFICHVLLSSMLLYMPPLWEATIFHSSLHTVHQFTGETIANFLKRLSVIPRGLRCFVFHVLLAS